MKTNESHFILQKWKKQSLDITKKRNGKKTKKENLDTEIVLKLILLCPTHTEEEKNISDIAKKKIKKKKRQTKKQIHTGMTKVKLEQKKKISREGK